MDKKYIYAIDSLILVGTIVIFVGMLMFIRPNVNSPIDGYVAYGPVLFSFQNAEKILIDDNLEFTSPTVINVRDDLVINLKPGDYYWKAEGVLTSEVRQLKIVSEVDLKLKKKGNYYEVVNSGTVPLNVSVYSKGELTGNVVLDVDESEEVSGTEFVGRGNE